MTPDYAGAFSDIVRGVSNWRVWGQAGWQEIKRRYRRTALGPFWVTLSLGIFATAMGLIWAPLFNADVKTYLPFVTVGMVSWVYVTSTISEGCGTYTGAEGLIKQLNFPYMLLNCTVVWRNMIVFFHNLIIVVAVVVLLSVPVNLSTLLVVPGVLLVAINGMWITMLLGMLSARFRDIPPLVGNLIQVMMFVTPVFWFANQLGPGRQHIVTFNFLFHVVDIVRSPLLGQAPAALSYAVAIGGAVVGWTVTVMIYARFRRRIAYWL